MGHTGKGQPGRNHERLCDLTWESGTYEEIVKDLVGWHVSLPALGHWGCGMSHGQHWDIGGLRGCHNACELVVSQGRHRPEGCVSGTLHRCVYACAGHKRQIRHNGGVEYGVGWDRYGYEVRYSRDTS